MSSLNEINLANPHLAENYMPRPRIDRILDRATRCQLVYVIVGAGYGKTQAVRHYVGQQPDAIVRWVQLSESDNISSRYWENLARNISFDNPDLADQLRELGFPETAARFKQFAEILKSTEHCSRKTFFVLDDFHLIHSKQVLKFAERCAYLHIPGACMIIVSRKEPAMNVVPLLSKGKVSIITEDELRFTDEETAAFLKQCGIPFSLKELPRLIGATRGWALAIQLLSMVLKRFPKNLDLALDTMKQNIFKLLEMEAFNDLPERIQKTMARLALVSDLPLMVSREFFDGASFLRNAPQLTSFMWFDSFTGDYKVHPLYWEFLQSKQDILSRKEKQDTYLRAAQWCSENNYYLDAINCYAKSRQFQRMLETLLSYPHILPRDACEYVLTILENLEPDDEERSDASFLMLKSLFIPLLLVGAGRYEEARERSLDTIREWEHADTIYSAYLLGTAYSNLSYISIYTCTVSHQYDFSKYLKKSLEYFERSPIPQRISPGAFTVADIRSYACLVGEGASLSEFEEFLESARKNASYIAETPHSMYCGYDDLAACEFAFYKNQIETAKNYAHQAILKAREKYQHSIEAMAAFYLFRIAALEGDYPLMQGLLKQGRDNAGNPNFWNRRLLYDLGVGFLYAHIGLYKMAPAWLSMDEKESAFDVSIPVRELICGVKYYFAAKQYGQALTLLCSSYPREPQERFLLGELTLTLLTAAARARTGDAPGAVKDFEKAYALSFDGVFEMPFIELGKDLQPLIVAAGKQSDCSIPEEWLKAIGRKASVYAKRLAVILNAFKKEKNIEDAPQLSEREREVLNDLYQGLSREEIAEARFLSINTVNKIITSIYIKLDANNIADAIRIAIKKNLIK